MEYTVDAKDRSIGRISSEVAVLLMGKNLPSYRKNIAPDIKVTIINGAQANISQKKTKEKKYHHYTGYPGGLRERSLEEIIAKKGYAEVYKKAVRGMLPDNRLRDKMLKNLVISE